ncbi:MAG: trypsin-like peptidase domain-containing protein [Candidatus Polarisedimenticolia bacterium]
MMGRRAIGIVAILAVLFAVGVAEWPGAVAPEGTPDAVCPRCGAPLEPGAAFCSACGTRLATPAPVAPAAPGADPRTTVAQVIAAHDRKMTSAFAAIVYGSKAEVNSLLGSAFAVAPGEFVTDAGLLLGAGEVTLRAFGFPAVPARVIGVDPLLGVALLAADLPQIAPLSRRDELPRAGESVRALGFPSAPRTSGEPSATAGVVSGVHRTDFEFHPVEDYIQTDASRPDGFTGGPVVDGAGRLVAMSTGGVRGGQVTKGLTAGISVSIPLRWIDRGLEWIRSGAPSRAWLGIHTRPVDAESRAEHSLPDGVWHVVTFVYPDSPAATAGLKRGDGLLRFQGDPVVTLIDLRERLLLLKPGVHVTLAISRKSATQDMSVALTPRPGRPRLTPLDTLGYYGGLVAGPRSDTVIAVTAVRPGTMARAAKIAPGDVLQSILIKKDLEHAERDTARWRTVHGLKELEDLMASAYSEFDFFVGLRFKSKDGQRRELFLWDVLSPTDAL